MPRYIVRDGQRLPHHGQVLEAGTEVELPVHVAEDKAVSGLVRPAPTEPVLAAAQPPAEEESKRVARGASRAVPPKTKSEDTQE